MRLAIESTDEIVTVDGVECRVWRVMELAGRNAWGGVVLVHRISAPEGSAFQRAIADEFPPKERPAEAIDEQLARAADLPTSTLVIDPRMVM